MAQKLAVTIALEGGKLVEQQLEGIGAAGKKAFEDISQAAQKAGGFKNLKPEDVTAKLKDLGIVGEDAFKKITDAVQSATRMETLVGVVQNVEKGFAGVAAAAGSLARALPGIGAVAAIIGGTLVKTMLDAADAIHKADTEAIKLGLSIEKFDQLKRGFEAMGFSAGAISTAIANVNSQIEKLEVEKIKQAGKELQEGATRGFGVLGTSQWQLLTEAMQGTGAAAAAARTEIEKLGGVAPAVSALDRLGIAAGSASTVIPEFIEAMRELPDTAQRTADAIAVLGDKAGIQFIQILRNGGVGIEQFKQDLGGLTQEQANAANKVEQSWNRVNAAWERLKTTIGGTLLVNVPDNLIAAMQTIDNLLNPAKWTEWGDAAKQAFIDLFAPIGELQVKIAQLIASLPGWLGNVLGGGSGGGGESGGGIPGNAAGGLIGGRGTGTSDSNLAWVSRGEHIMPARAVRQPGVLALLEALRRTGGNLRGVMDGMGRFALGGVVPQLPRFAEGGLVGGMQHLGTVDLRTDHGTARLMASSSAVEQLTRLAVTKRMTSTGKKPGFIG